MVLVRWDQDATRKVNDTILCNGVLNLDRDISVELHTNDASPPSDVDGNVLVTKQRGDIQVVMSTADIVTSLGIRLGVICIRVDDLVGDNVVLVKESAYYEEMMY